MERICASCGSLLEPGITVCPGCRLPLAAQAIALPKRQPRTLFSPAMNTLLAIAAVVVLINLFSRWVDDRHNTAREALVQQLRAGTSTPEAFEAACGPATGRRIASGKTILEYGDIRVIFSGKPGQAVEIGRAIETAKGPLLQTSDEEWALGMIQCRALFD